jgi:FtsZ-binding cell division protein ZapB
MAEAAAALRAFGERFVATPDVSRDELVVPPELLPRPVEELRCAICLEFPMAPWVLSCDHPFCKPCLDAHRKRGALACPICRAETVDTMKLSRPLRAIMQSADFRCYEPGCFWKGHSWDSAKRHWTFECALVKAISEHKKRDFAEVRMQLEMESLKMRMNSLSQDNRDYLQMMTNLRAENMQLNLDLAEKTLMMDETVRALVDRNQRLESETRGANKRCRDLVVALANCAEAAEAAASKRCRKAAHPVTPEGVVLSPDYFESSSSAASASVLTEDPEI